MTIPSRPGRGKGTFAIVFDPATSQLLFWSETGRGGGTPDQWHTLLLRQGSVHTTRERPGPGAG